MRARLVESKRAKQGLDKAPGQVWRAYEVWARLIEEHGTKILREFKAYHDEKLSGQWKGHRSSRLNRKWRVIYSEIKVGQTEVVTVKHVSAHDYRRRE